MPPSGGDPAGPPAHAITGQVQALQDLIGAQGYGNMRKGFVPDSIVLQAELLQAAVGRQAGAELGAARAQLIPAELQHLQPCVSLQQASSGEKATCAADPAPSYDT